MAFLDESGLERLWYQIVSKLGTKVDAIEGKSLSENDYTTAEKEKLAGIAEGATNVVVDDELSASSTNPVQNKVIQTQFESLQDQLSAKQSMFGHTTTSDDGVAYSATVDGITALTSGISFIMIPNINSTSTTPTLNVNNLGAKGLRMRGSTGTGTAMSASISAWITANRPVQVTYNGLFWLAEVTRPAASDLSGTVDIAQGGTGAADAVVARTNLDVYSKDETVAKIEELLGVIENGSY